MAPPVGQCVHGLKGSELSGGGDFGHDGKGAEKMSPRKEEIKLTLV